MRKQRYYPFGYKMENGKIKEYLPESSLIPKIYDLYLSGESYLSISKILSKGTVPYHLHKSQWNKNMVKRILEDERYLGGEFPKVIETNAFMEVQELIKAKSPKKKYSVETRTYKTEFICGECAKSLNNKLLVKNLLTCENQDCSQYAITVTKEIFVTRIENDYLKRQQTETAIKLKTEYQQPVPSETILVTLVETSASESYSVINPLPTAIIKITENFRFEDLQRYKRVVVYSDSIKIV